MKARKSAGNSDEDIRSLKKRIADLEAENEVLRKKQTSKITEGLLGVVKRLGTLLLIIITTISISVSVTSFWLKRNVVKTDVWVEKTTAIIQEPAVVSSVSERLASRLFEWFDAETVLAESLPPRVQPFAGSIASSLQSFTQGKIAGVLASDEFVSSWERASASAHKGILISLENGGQANEAAKQELLYIEGDKILLNLQPLFAQIKSRLVSSGLGFLENVTLPIDSTVPIVTIQSMSQTLKTFNVINKAAIVFLVIALISGAGAMWLSIKKRRTLLAICVTVIVFMIISVQLVFAARYPLLEEAARVSVTQQGAAAAVAIFDILTKDLVVLLRIVMAIMLAIIGVTIISGPSRFAIGIRQAFGRLASLEWQPTTKTAWIAHNAQPLFAAIAILTGLLIVFPPVDGLFFILVVLIFAAVCSLVVASIQKSVRDENAQDTIL